MGQLIAFPNRSKTGSEPASRVMGRDMGRDTESRSEVRPLKKGPGADILLFTGVRYERTVSLPSQRLPSPAARR